MPLHDFNIPELSAPFVFRRRPATVPGDLRPGWRIGLVVLLMSECCRSARTSLTRLHVLNWSIRSPETRAALLAIMDGSDAVGSLIVRFEPFLNRAVDFGIGEGLIKRAGGGKTIELTNTGKRLAGDLKRAENAFSAEKQFIASIGQKVTERFVDDMFGKGAR
ncbi:MAG TPA: hypothetical protein VN736_24655 [Candidatus Limnocylindrales bacterium]|nr:hypothetical protein [Candidatus Limnocylindrales bacterium]